MKSKKIEINGIEITAFEDGSIEKPHFTEGLVRTFGTKRPDNYMVVKLGRKLFLVHRLIAEAFLNDWDCDLQIDHINGDSSFNSRHNLRMVTNQGNQLAFKRKKIGTSSIYRGVCWENDRNKWKMQIHKDGEHFTQRFESEFEAAKAYDEAAINLGFFKEALNF